MAVTSGFCAQEDTTRRLLPTVYTGCRERPGKKQSFQITPPPGHQVDGLYLFKEEDWDRLTRDIAITLPETASVLPYTLGPFSTRSKPIPRRSPSIRDISISTPQVWPKIGHHVLNEKSMKGWFVNAREDCNKLVPKRLMGDRTCEIEFQFCTKGATSCVLVVACLAVGFSPPPSISLIGSNFPVVAPVRPTHAVESTHVSLTFQGRTLDGIIPCAVLRQMLTLLVDPSSSSPAFFDPASPQSNDCSDWSPQSTIHPSSLSPQWTSSDESPGSPCTSDDYFASALFAPPDCNLDLDFLVSLSSPSEQAF